MTYAEYPVKGTGASYADPLVPNNGGQSYRDGSIVGGVFRVLMDDAKTDLSGATKTYATKAEAEAAWGKT